MAGKRRPRQIQMNRTCAIGHLFMTVGAVCSAQTALPNQIDLRAAYCRGHLAAQIQFVQSFEGVIGNLPSASDAVASHNALIEKLKGQALRLDRYLLPRTRYLEMDGLALAALSGREDHQLASNEVGRCIGAVEGCLPGAKSWESCREACAQKSQAMQRTERCKDLNFLPN